MNTKERNRLLDVYGRFYRKEEYEKLTGERFKGCFYCGDLAASTVDHVPPLRWIEAKPLDYWRKNGGLLKVAACRLCNGCLSSRPLFTLSERAEWIAKRLSAEYQAKVTLWLEDEILEISPSFQRVLRARKEQFTDLLARVKHAELRALLLSESDQDNF